jgi:hypothetical protein
MFDMRVAGGGLSLVIAMRDWFGSSATSVHTTALTG